MSPHGLDPSLGGTEELWMISREGSGPDVITAAGRVPLAAAERPPLSYCESLHCAERGSDEGVSAHSASSLTSGVGPFRGAPREMRGHLLRRVGRAQVEV